MKMLRYPNRRTSRLAIGAACLFVLVPTRSPAADLPVQPTLKGTLVQSNIQPPSMPPEVGRYLYGPTSASRQFEFLIGDWDVDAARLIPDGSVLFRYRATWAATYLNEGRMVMDDFKALAPDGRPISSYVTLRTYSEVSGRWEMSGLAALQPAGAMEWHGVWTGTEMLIDAAGVDPSGRSIRTKIRFSNITHSGFAWESEASADDGKTWTRTASLLATRAAAR